MAPVAPVAPPTAPVAAPVAEPTAPVAAPVAEPTAPVAEPTAPVAAPVDSSDSAEGKHSCCVRLSSGRNADVGASVGGATLSKLV